MSVFISAEQPNVWENEYYRRTVHTTPLSQIVYMNLKGTEDIPGEIHEGDQYLHIHQGTCDVTINHIDTFELGEGDIILIPSGTHHYIRKTSNSDLKLVSMYTPPEHYPGEINVRQPDEDES